LRSAILHLDQPVFTPPSFTAVPGAKRNHGTRAKARPVPARRCWHDPPSAHSHECPKAPGPAKPQDAPPRCRPAPFPATPGPPRPLPPALRVNRRGAWRPPSNRLASAASRHADHRRAAGFGTGPQARIAV
jgi:hypothetical protein